MWTINPLSKNENGYGSKWLVGVDVFWLGTSGGQVDGTTPIFKAMLGEVLKADVSNEGFLL